MQCQHHLRTSIRLTNANARTTWTSSLTQQYEKQPHQRGRDDEQQASTESRGKSNGEQRGHYLDGTADQAELARIQMARARVVEERQSVEDEEAGPGQLLAGHHTGCYYKGAPEAPAAQ